MQMDFVGLPRWLSGKESTCQRRRCRRHMFNLWIRKIPWSRKWQPTPVFLPGKSYRQRSLVGYSPWGRKESDMTERLHLTLVENYLDFNNCSHLVLAVCFYICNYIMNFVSKWIRHLSYKWLFMLLQFPLPPLAITQGPWLRDPQYEDKENMLPQQFRVYNPFPAGRSYRTISPPLSLATIFS